MTPKKKIEDYLKDRLPGWEFVDTWEEKADSFEIDEMPILNPPIAWHLTVASPTGRQYEVSCGEQHIFPGWKVSEWGVDGYWDETGWQVKPLKDAPSENIEEVSVLNDFLRQHAVDDTLTLPITQHHARQQMRDNQQWANTLVGQQITRAEAYTDYVVFTIGDGNTHLRVERFGFGERKIS